MLRFFSLMNARIEGDFDIGMRYLLLWRMRRPMRWFKENDKKDNEGVVIDYS